jgi:hypothetical protein
MSKAWQIAGAALVAVALVVATLASTASATDPYKALNRKVNRLENRVDGLQSQVTGLKRDVKVLMYDVFACTFPGGNPVSFADGTVAYTLYYDSRCVASAGSASVGSAPNGSGRQVRELR